MRHFLFSMVFIGFSQTALSTEKVFFPPAPQIKASSWLLVDFDSGHTLAQKDIDRKLAPASLTKIMTVYVVADELRKGRIAITDEVLVSEKAWRMKGSRTFIEVDKVVQVEDLLYGVIVQSGNDASVALSEYVAGDENNFVKLMNRHARRLGMKDTHYANSTGLPHPEHYTTATDLAILARALINDFPEIYTWHAVKEFTFSGIRQRNRNDLLWRDVSVDGIKTGHTEEAGYCLVASAIRDGMRLISVVMGADSTDARNQASWTLLNYGYRFYETHKLYSSGDFITRAKIWQADTEVLNIGLRQDVYITVPRGQYEKLRSVVEVDRKIIAPVNKGEQKGVLNIMLADKKLKTLPLLAFETIPEGSMFKRIKDKVYLFLSK